MSHLAPADILKKAGLLPHGPVTWGTHIDSNSPGVYVVEWGVSDLENAPVCLEAVRKWLSRVPGLQVDGKRPTPEQLSERLTKFWVPCQSIVYIGKSDRPLHVRLREYSTTVLGHSKPHAGGMWLKALRNFAQCRLWWADSSTPAEKETELLQAFHRHTQRLPFANLVATLMGSDGTHRRLRKQHGLSNQRVPAL